ncbi:phospholipase D-like domain-containing protein [Ectobacillus sp. JY-23]|uniref:phospholipase D-like domain-containing protein n=1 Tax=Ectobacillus sp. JY-23 TaxID=2933872 RepID=UPI001FF44A35|nr:phospholipase D-like domain-containing protein [Ectobacillus sp. JY-23]UOY91082.1 phospholipase D-like domain-containing protein [Ectobacillus sp. JY-23]
MLKKFIFASLCGLVLIVLFFWMDHDVKAGKQTYVQTHPLVISPVHTGDLRLYTEGQTFYHALFHDIEKARHSIYIHFFIIGNDHISKSFLELLEKRAKQGIRVKLSADLLGAHSITLDMLKRMHRNGIEFTYSRKVHWQHPFYTLHRRNHRRIAVIDGTISYIGGFNIGKEYLGKNKKLGKWRDYQIRIVGTGAFEAQRQFLKDWEEDTGEVIKPVATAQPPGKVPHQYLYTSGTGLEKHMLQQIQGAAQSIIIANPYFAPSKRVTAELTEALRRGVQVKILVTKKTDAWFTQPPAYIALQTLTKHGAKVYEYQKGFFHGKVMITDNKTLEIGTSNWDQRSFFINDESNCIIYDKDAIEMVHVALRKDFGDAKEMKHADFKNLPLWVRVLRHTPERIVYYL